ncbi:MAG: tRNA 2-thiouridine(34) synthase MnmA [Gammaproteobacteria bacterium]|nr:tRNA 2-thiouridine(34) synthase MnmA [Gammaproteobacteria bacterium]
MNIVIGMSGGVDSSVAALLLKQQGHDVSGVFMVNWDEDDEFCTARQDYQDAIAVAEQIGIPLEKANFSKEYWDGVFENFLAEYSKGRTPNPDILCNKEVKFKAFLDYACDLGCDAVATGHYASTDIVSGRTHLTRAIDQNKDQTYFLHAIDRSVLDQVVFPLGQLPKPEVRRIASEHGLHVHSKSDSTGICFIGERNFREFLSKYLPSKPGEIRTLEGHLIGQHPGLIYYTLGQRKGLGIGGVKGYPEAPWFVVGKALESNTLVVTQGTDHESLYSCGLQTDQFNWLADCPNSVFRCSAKTRYREPDQDCEVTLLPTGGVTVNFDKPVRAVTPGQSIVLYQDQICLGGGVIERVTK